MSQLIGRAKIYAYVVQSILQNQRIGGRMISAVKGARHISFGVRLSNPDDLSMAMSLSDKIAYAANVEHVLIQRYKGVLVYQFQLPQGLWAYYNRSDLPDSHFLGLAEQKRPIAFSFEHSPHALIAGTTGSGKTETVKSLGVSLATTYKPSELEMIIINPKRDMTEFENLAHLAMPICYEIEDGHKAVQWVNEQLRERIGKGITKKLVLLIDEPDVLGLDGSKTLKANLQTIAQIGRSENVHLIISTQKPSHRDLPKILDNLINRFVGLVSDAGVSVQLTGKSGLQAHMLTGKGDFIHSEGNLVERFQVALATKQDFEKLPRAEIKQPEILKLPVFESIEKGRPKLEIEGDILAEYCHRGPKNISRKEAFENFNLSQRGHERHQEEARKFIKKIKELRGRK